MTDSLDIGVLSFHNSKETKCILNCVNRLGHNGYWMAEPNIEIHMGSEVNIRPEVDSVINRLLLSTAENPTELLGIADAISQSVPMLNEPKNVLPALNKISSTARISNSQNGDVPESLFADDYYLSAFIDETGECVKKNAIGTHGDGTRLVNSIDEMFTSLNGSNYSLVQERIQQRETSDVRVYVVDGEVIASMKRKPSGDEWRANIARGGRAEEFELNDGVEQDVLQVCEEFGLDYAGVDIMEGEDGWKFLEVNPTAGFKGLFNATGVSPAPYIAAMGIRAAGGSVEQEEIEELSNKLYDSYPPRKPVRTNKGEKPVLGLEETILVGGKDRMREVEAKVDTGADRTSVDTKLAADVGLGPIRKYARVRTASADSPQVRPVVPVTLKVGGMKHDVNASIEDRSNMNYDVILGRDVLGRHRIDPTKSKEE